MCGAVLSEVSGVSACVAAVQYDHTAAASAAHSKHVCPESSSRAHEDMCQQTVVEAAHSLKGCPRGAQATSSARPHCSSVV